MLTGEESLNLELNTFLPGLIVVPEEADERFELEVLVDPLLDLSRMSIGRQVSCRVGAEI